MIEGCGVCERSVPCCGSAVMEEYALAVEGEVSGSVRVETTDIRRRRGCDTQQRELPCIDQWRNQHCSIVPKGDVAGVEEPRDEHYVTS